MKSGSTSKTSCGYKGFRECAFDAIRACLTALGYESLTRTVIADDNGPVRFAKTLNRSVLGVDERTRQVCSGQCGDIRVTAKRFQKIGE